MKLHVYQLSWSIEWGVWRVWGTHSLCSRIIRWLIMRVRNFTAKYTPCRKNTQFWVDCKSFYNGCLWENILVGFWTEKFWLKLKYSYRQPLQNYLCTSQNWVLFLQGDTACDVALFNCVQMVKLIHNQYQDPEVEFIHTNIDLVLWIMMLIPAQSQWFRLIHCDSMLSLCPFS